MQLRARTPIGELYEEVRERDIAITAYPRLSLALDGRVERPRIGRVAATAHSYASGEIVPIDRRQLFLTILDETELSFKQAQRGLEYCLHCWDWTGDVTEVLTYDEFDDRSMHTVVEVLQSTDSSYRELTDTRLQTSADAAVLGRWTLSPLDSTLLPESCQSVDLFTGEQWELPAVQVFESPRGIVEATVEALSATSATNTAVVVDRSTVYPALLEAALEAADIPYEHSEAFVDDDSVRAALRLLQCAFVGSTLRVEDVRPSLRVFDLEVSGDSTQRLAAVEGALAERLRGWFQTVRTETVEVALRSLMELTGWHSRELVRELQRLGIADERPTESLVAQLRFYVSSFDVPTEADDDTDGVAIVDCSSTTYVDRQTVFYVGLGTGWARTPPDVPWIDTTEFTERDIKRFQLLLQNGHDRRYFVQRRRAGDPVRPCPYFDELAEADVRTFTDLPHRLRGRVDRRRDTDTEPFESPESQPVSIETVSQSTLKRLVNCPRDEYFYRLLDDERSYPMVFGSVVHEAAEIRIAAPDSFHDRYDEILSEMYARLDPFVPPSRRPVVRTELETALETLEEFLEHTTVERHEPTGYGSLDNENTIADELGITIASPITERWFESKEVGLRGFVDLIRTRQTLVDYKTGTQLSASKRRRRAAVDSPHRKPDFQAPAYLSHHRQQNPKEESSIEFVNLREHSDQLARGAEIDPAEYVTSVRYLPSTLGEFATRREVYEEITDYADSNDRVRALGPLGYERYSSFFERHSLPREGEAPERRSAIVQKFVEYTKECVKDTKYVEQGCKSAVSDIDDLAEEHYSPSELDAFESFVDEQIENLERFHRDGFPVRNDEDGPNWDRVDYRPLVIDDE